MYRNGAGGAGGSCEIQMSTPYVLNSSLINTSQSFNTFSWINNSIKNCLADYGPGVDANFFATQVKNNVITCNKNIFSQNTNISKNNWQGLETTWGGAFGIWIYFLSENNSLTVDNTLFESNAVGTGGGALFWWSRPDRNLKITIFNSNFTSNSALSFGGAVLLMSQSFINTIITIYNRNFYSN